MTNPFTKKVPNNHAYYLILIALLLAGIWTWCTQMEAEQAMPVPPAHAEEVTAAERAKLCSLDAVVCPGEEKPKQIVQGIVTNYQAVPEQTDGSPCTGAWKKSIDMCNPPFPIVAANGWKFGTHLKIRGIVYTVADRMNPRYGSDHFDILTPPSNGASTPKGQTEAIEVIPLSK